MYEIKPVSHMTGLPVKSIILLLLSQAELPVVPKFDISTDFENFYKEMKYQFN